MLSEEATKEIMQNWAAQFNQRLEMRLWPIWQKDLTRSGMTVGNYERLYRAFIAAWPGGRFPPALNDFRRFVWTQMASERAAMQHARPHEDCALCEGTGYVPVPVPTRLTGGYDPMARGFNPPAVWARTALYTVGVPCKCSMGKRAADGTPVSDVWAEARRRAENAFPSGRGLYAYVRDCHQARARNEAARGQSSTESDEVGPDDAQGPIEPGEAAGAPQADFTGIATGVRAATLERQRENTVRTADVGPDQDVADEEIPW